MENDEKHYGRKRVKKPKPLIGQSKSDSEALQTTMPIGENVPAEKAEEPSSETRESPAPAAPPKQRPGAGREETRRRRERQPRMPRERGGKPDRERRGSPEHKPRERAGIRVSIVIPAFNEVENIVPLLKQLDEVIRKYRDWEVILVDDGSTDDTGRIARQNSGRYRWLKLAAHNRNRGLTAALETGFKMAEGSIFVFYPADLQYHAEEIPKLISRIDRGADVVAGWKQGKYNKRFVSSVYNRICRFLFNIKIHDLNSVKAFRKEIVDSIPMRRDWHRYMVVLASENDFAIDEIKVTLYPRAHGTSKFGRTRVMGAVLDLISVKFQISFTKSPLRFFGFWGFITGFAGFVVGLIALYLRFFTTHGSRTLLYLVILLVLTGLGLFALGFLAEVMVGLRDEINSLKRKR